MWKAISWPGAWLLGRVPPWSQEYGRRVVVRFRIVGRDLPGAACGGYADVHVGVQRGREVVNLVPGDAAEAVFSFEVPVRDGAFAGPYVHGRGADRFLYLSWGELVDGEFRMFRRAKLMLDAVDAAAADGREVRAELRLTDARGGPVCAAVRPPRVAWTVG